MNYFTLLELPEALPVNQATLASHYQRLQHQYHPDRFVAAPEHQKNSALRRSVEINEGFKILKDPLLSAKHFLSLQGVVDSLQSFHDVDFLQSQLLLREQLDEIEHISDKSQLADALAQLKKQIVVLNQTHYDALWSAINEAQWTQAQHQIQRLHFFEKILRQIEQDEDNLFDF